MLWLLGLYNFDHSTAPLNNVKRNEFTYQEQFMLLNSNQPYVLQKITLEMVLCFQNYSDQLWEKIVLVIEIFFWKFKVEGREYRKSLKQKWMPYKKPSLCYVSKMYGWVGSGDDMTIFADVQYRVLCLQSWWVRKSWHNKWMVPNILKRLYSKLIEVRWRQTHCVNIFWPLHVLWQHGGLITMQDKVYVLFFMGVFCQWKIR